MILFLLKKLIYIILIFLLSYCMIMEQKEITPEQVEDLKQFYKTFDLTKVKNIAHLQDEILYQLYKNQKEAKIQPTFDIYPRNFIHQADILYLPNDNGYKYALTVVDLGSRLTECMPMKSKSSKATAEALQKIYGKPAKSRILSKPSRIEVDAGSEFKAEFKKYCDDNKINVRYAEPFRSRQQALAESRNGSIAKPLLRRMLAEELLTDKTCRKWVEYLPKVIEFLNERFKRTDAQIKELQKQTDKLLPVDKFNADLLEKGQKVRYKLDKPIDITTGQRLHGNFRTGDVKWSKPTEITEVMLIPNQLPLYKVKNRTNHFTKDQLQAINPTENLPPASIKIKPANHK